MEPQLLVSSPAAQTSRLDPAGPMPLSWGWWAPAFGVLASHPRGTSALPLSPFTWRCCLKQGAAVTEGLRRLKLIQLGRCGEASPPSILGLLPGAGDLGVKSPFPLSVTVGQGPGGLALCPGQRHVVRLAVPAMKQGERPPTFPRCGDTEQVLSGQQAPRRDLPPLWLAENPDVWLLLKTR